MSDAERLLVKTCDWRKAMRSFCFLSLVGFLVAALGYGAAAEKGEKTMTRPKPTYRVLYNYDSGPVFEGADANMSGRVEAMVDEVADGGADVLLICACDQRTYYPSKVWQTHWEGFTEGDRSFFGSIPEKTVQRRAYWVRNMARLAEQCDYLEAALAHCRERGIAPGISLRMNDMHDAPWPDSHLFSRFYKDNPQLHLKPLPGRSWGAAGLDYAHPEVRAHYLALVGELAQGYDFDVLELDFLRFPFYFSRDDTAEHCDTMTGFIRDVREILDGVGRPVALIPRVASSPGAARQLGFDVQTWAREGLIDGITAGNMLTTSWDVAIEQFRDAVGPRVAVYASMSVAADRREGLPVRYLPESYEMLRGFAAGYLAAGADGINAFNFFLARQHRPVSAREFFGGLREMRSLEEARSKPRTHLLSAGYRIVECDAPEQVPMSIRAWTSRRFQMLLAAAGEDAEVTALVTFDGENGPDDLWLRIGLHHVGHAVEVREGPEGNKEDKAARKSKIAVFNVPPGVITDGRDELIIRSEKTDATILGIDVCVR